MKTIGILGGMSWQSTVTYYKLINAGVAEKLGGLHSAKLLLHSVEFAEIEAMQLAGQWDEAGQLLARAAKGLENAGAELMLIGTNTMHKVAPAVQAGIGIPLLHIADATADALKAAGIHKAGLLGTKYTMQEDFYTGRLQAQGIEVVLPAAPQMDEVNRIIFEELCAGRILEPSRRTYLSIIDELAGRGAQGVILGCTEIGLLVTPADTTVPLFDTTVVHAARAVELALAD